MLGLLCLLFNPMLVAAPAAPAAAPAARTARPFPWPWRRRPPKQTYYFDPRLPAYFSNPHKPK